MIDFASKMPLYYQLYEILYGKITRGDWQPGVTIPSEAELVDHYRVSRGTVRQALDLLVNEGLIDRQRGRGTFVTQPSIQQIAGKMITFTEDMRRRGLSPATKLLFSGLMPAPESIARKLGLETGEEVARIDRLRLAQGEPMSIEEAYLVHRLCPGVLDHDYTKQSLRQVLGDRYGLYQAYGDQVVRAIIAPADIAAQLGGPAGPLAILYIERISYSLHNEPVEFLRLYHRGDRYALQNELTGWLPDETE